MKIGGLDIGTTGCKLTVFDENGKFLDKAYRSYPSRHGVGEHEIDASYIWEAVQEVMKEIARKYPDLFGFGITSFGETFVMTDEEGKPLCPSMLYTDPRGEEETEKLIQVAGDGKKIAAVTGLKPHSMYSLPKIMWMKEHRPDIYRKTEHIFLIADYIIYMLTGVRKIDYSLATRTMAFDIRHLTWSKTLLNAAGVDASLLSEPVRTGSVAGTLRREIAEQTGFSEDLKIISVGHDQIACTIGGGAFDSSTAVDGAGTVECMNPVYDSLPDPEAMYRGNFAVVPYVIPGKYICYAFSYTGGALISWCVDTLAKQEKYAAAALGKSVNQILEGDYREPTGILVLPHFAGAATPYMDSGSKGAILGLTIGNTVSDIYRACMEGVVYEMAVNMEYLNATGTHFERMYATGGGARSSVWMQMKADVLNVPFTALQTKDAGTVGSAMLTGIAAGLFRNLEDAADHMIVKLETYSPRREMHEKYMQIYQRYRRVYQAVRPLM
ncbi:MAG TPA: carbohydrate kinase [Lachnospiraceae bacterium]|nr:FGGY family carbohydrate kinase [Lachnospiraceae bacterium]HBB62051.1 carbohydrate kinase [Lachnospiraceae bacterium]